MKCQYYISFSNQWKPIYVENENVDVVTTISISLIKIYFKVFFVHKTFSDSFLLLGVLEKGKNKSLSLSHLYTYQNTQSQRISNKEYKYIPSQDNTSLRHTCLPLFVSFFAFLWLTTDHKTTFSNKMNTIYFHLPFFYAFTLFWKRKCFFCLF